MTQKIVINKCFGGFSLSDEAINRLKELGYSKKEIKKDLVSKKDSAMYGRYWGLREVPRNHPLLIQVVKEMGYCVWCCFGSFVYLVMLAFPRLF